MRLLRFVLSYRLLWQAFSIYKAYCMPIQEQFENNYLAGGSGILGVALTGRGGRNRNLQLSAVIDARTK